jgi:hypothetical protein
MAILKCSECGTDRVLTDAGAYEATRLGRTMCRGCARKLGKQKISKYSSSVKVGDMFGSWQIVKYIRENGEKIECRCVCGTSRMFKTSQMVKGKHPAQCRKCSIGVNASNWRGLGDMPMSVFTKIKLGAKKRNKSFSLTPEYIWELYKKQNGKCALSGLPISFIEEGKNLSESKGNASLDRIDSSLGYIEGNVQWTHKHINSMKNEYSAEYFIKLCKEVVLYYDIIRDT